MTCLLCDWEIESAVNKKDLGIDPYDKCLINPNSVDLRLGDQFVIYSQSNDIIDPYDGDSIGGYSENKFHCDSLIVNPGDFILGRTLERITLPDFFSARVEGKSSLARLGITIHQTGGWIDSGFDGTITLEISNVNKRPVKLYAGMPICQMAIFLTNKPSLPYNKRVNSKYNGQIFPTVSKYWKNIKQDNYDKHS